MPVDRSTPKLGPRKPEERGSAPGPLLAVMASLIVILLVVSLVTRQWQYLLLGLFGVGAGIVPFLNRRQ